MPARLAYPFVYHECTRRLDDDARLEVDAILGDPDAAAQIDANRLAATIGIDAEVG